MAIGNNEWNDIPTYPTDTLENKLKRLKKESETKANDEIYLDDIVSNWASWTVRAESEDGVEYITLKEAIEWRSSPIKKLGTGYKFWTYDNDFIVTLKRKK